MMDIHLPVLLISFIQINQCLELERNGLDSDKDELS